jgi:hypothetical protein
MLRDFASDRIGYLIPKNETILYIILTHLILWRALYVLQIYRNRPVCIYPRNCSILHVDKIIDRRMCRSHPISVRFG